MSNIFIIVVEGKDKTGKKTQTDLLVDYLLKQGYKAIKSEFHRYDTLTGQLIMEWLQKKWDAPQQVIEIIMAYDKQNQQKWFKQLEREKYDFLVLDRYTLSQFAYGSATGGDIKWLEELQEYIRKPDLDIVIEIDSETSMNRKGKHNEGNNDKYESDKDLLDRVGKAYRNTPLKYSAPNREFVNGIQTIDEIHRDIVEAVTRHFLRVDAW